MFPVQLGVQMKNRSSHCAHNADRPYFWRITGKGDALGLEDFGSGEDVVAPKRDGLKLADAPLVTFGRVEGEASLRARDEEFNPALCVRERLVSNHFQSQGLGVELQRNVLIANRNAYKLNSPNHKCPSSVRCAEHSQEN